MNQKPNGAAVAIGLIVIIAALILLGLVAGHIHTEMPGRVR